jgi:hypothetical protein
LGLKKSLASLVELPVYFVHYVTNTSSLFGIKTWILSILSEIDLEMSHSTKGKLTRVLDTINVESLLLFQNVDETLPWKLVQKNYVHFYSQSLRQFVIESNITGRQITVIFKDDSQIISQDDSSSFFYLKSEIPEISLVYVIDVLAKALGLSSMTDYYKHDSSARVSTFSYAGVCLLTEASYLRTPGKKSLDFYSEVEGISEEFLASLRSFILANDCLQRLNIDLLNAEAIDAFKASLSAISNGHNETGLAL